MSGTAETTIPTTKAGKSLFFHYFNIFLQLLLKWVKSFISLLCYEILHDYLGSYMIVLLKYQFSRSCHVITVDV